MTRALFLTLSLLALTACRQASNETDSLLPDTLQLQAGDVVFRRCTGITSRMVVFQDREGFFSHTGIVVDSAGVMMIVHAVPDEPDFPGDPDRVKMSAPQQFFSRSQVVAAAVSRPRDAAVGSMAARYAMEIYRRGVLFDHDFDDGDTTRMYCTELITHAYHRAGVELVDSQRHVIDLPSMHFRCILPSQVLNSPYLQPIFMFNS